MNLRYTATAALAACIGVAVLSSAQAQRQYEYQTANPFRTQNPFRDARQHQYQSVRAHLSVRPKNQLRQFPEARPARPIQQHSPVVQYVTTPEHIFAERKESILVHPRLEQDSQATFAAEHHEIVEAAQHETFEQIPCDSCSTGECCGTCDCCDSGCFEETFASCPTGGRTRGTLLGSGLFSRPGQFFIGVDYLNVRSTFSEATAFVTSTGGTPLSGSSLLFPPVVNTFNELEYDYESSYRVYGGYRLCECDTELRFAYTRFTSNADADTGNVPAPSNGMSTQFLSAYSGDLVVTNSGDSLSVNSDVAANLYDLDFAKSIPLGRSDNECCDPCNTYDPCCDSGCGWCPPWDLKWSAGLRFASVDWDHQTVRNSLTPAINGDSAAMNMEFRGGGIRAGLEGIRYLGRQRMASLFVRSNLSLLLGEVEIEHYDDTPATPDTDITTRFSSTQLIPVLDLEAGGRVNLTENAMISAGYLFSAWHDLGMRSHFDPLAGRGPMFDDANILGFDGFFARAEISY